MLASNYIGSRSGADDLGSSRASLGGDEDTTSNSEASSSRRLGGCGSSFDVPDILMSLVDDGSDADVSCSPCSTSCCESEDDV